MEKTLDGQDNSSLIDGNQSSAVAYMLPASPVNSSEKDLVKQGNFVSGEVEDLALVEEDLWEEEVPIGEWTTVGGKKNNKGKLKNRKKDGEKTELVPLKPSKKGPKPKGDSNCSANMPLGISRKHGDVGATLSPVGRPCNQ